MTSGFNIGQIGELKNQWFRVAGRLRYADSDGFWDEWCLEFNDGSFGWLEREDGETVLMRKQRLLSPLPPREQLAIGMTLQINDQPFFIVEFCPARITGFEGQLPFPVTVGQARYFVDGNMSGRPAVIEYGEGEIEFGLGEIIQRDELVFNLW